MQPMVAGTFWMVDGTELSKAERPDPYPTQPKSSETRKAKNLCTAA